MSFLSDINPFNPNSPIYLLPGPPLTKKQEKQGPFGSTQNAAGLPLPNPAGSNTSKVISNASSGLNSVTDFLNYIAWIVYPQNLLRAVEFVAGMSLGGYGIWLLTNRPGRGLARAAVTMSPVGRTIRVAQGTRMGRREGQREAARMTARQAETRSARESSAVEREQIRRSARSS